MTNTFILIKELILKKNSFLYFILLTFLISSCDSSLSSLSSSSSNGSSSSSSSTHENPEEENPFLDIPALENSQDYLDFFDPLTKLTFSFTATLSDIRNLEVWGVENRGNSEIYLPASLVISQTRNGVTSNVTFPDYVGIRMKGNTSRANFIHSDGRIYALINLKINFNKYGDTKTGNTLYDMEKLDLKWNRNLDGSQIRQAYAYKMYQDVTGFAPRSTLAKVSLTVTNTPSGDLPYDLGLYTANEVIDEVFLKRYFNKANAKGDLYKVTYTSKGKADFTSDNTVSGTYPDVTLINNGKIGIEDKALGYSPSYDLKENKKNSTHANLIDLIGWLNAQSSTSSITVKDGLKQRIYMDHFLKVEAARYLVGDPDDLRNNYNNTYVYFHPSTQKALFIPYDLDRGLGQHGNWNPTGDQMISVRPYSGKAYGANENQRNPLYQMTLMNNAVTDFKDQYKNNILQLIDNPWFNETRFNDLYNLYKTLYEGEEITSDLNLPYAPWNPDFIDNSYGLGQYNLSFASYLNSKKTTIIQSI